ncbi:MAG: DoxX family protein [Chitinophagaceae bacterium]
MRKLFSIYYSAAAFTISMLLLRIGAGALIMSHGYSKLVHFADMKMKFMNFLGIGSTLSLSLVIFAEFFCAIFLIIGLFSRLVVIPLIIATSVALFKAHNGDFFGDGEKPALFLTCFITLLLCGPGKVSVDGMMK